MCRRAWCWSFRSDAASPDPDHSLRRRIHVRPGDPADIGISRRARPGVLVSAGQLHPGPALIDELQHQCERRMIDAGRFTDARHMVKYDRRGRPLQKVCSLDDLIAQHMDLEMLAEIVDALRQWLEHVDCRGSGLDEIEADAANTEVVEPLRLPRSLPSCSAPPRSRTACEGDRSRENDRGGSWKTSNDRGRRRRAPSDRDGVGGRSSQDGYPGTLYGSPRRGKWSTSSASTCPWKPSTCAS